MGTLHINIWYVITGNIGDGTTTDNVNAIHKLKFENGNNLFIDSVSCGMVHTVILSPQNNLICFGRNNSNQCSTKITSDKIAYPHILSRDDELQYIQNDYIEKSIALFDTTILITNSYKKY